jgi:hypothetical protein
MHQCVCVRSSCKLLLVLLSLWPICLEPLCASPGLSTSIDEGTLLSEPPMGIKVGA